MIPEGWYTCVMFTYFICLTIVLFPDSPAPEKGKTESCNDISCIKTVKDQEDQGEEIDRESDQDRVRERPR